MPDNRGRAKRDDVAFLLQTPAEIDVVSGLAILDVEAADGIKGPAIKGHVTTGNVLGHGVGQQNVARSARRRRHAGLHPIFRRRRNVGAAHARVVAAEKRADQIIQPVGIGHAVGVGVGQNLTFGGSGPGVACIAQAVIILADIADVGKTGGDFRSVIG